MCFEIGDRFGRRGTIFVGMGFMVVGGALQASAWTLGQMMAGRLLFGIGLGLQAATVPMWQSECAKQKTRGRWAMIEEGLQTTGVACGQWIGYASFFTKGRVQWQMPVAIQLIPAAIVFCMIMFLPEPPRWLIKNGMFKETTQNLCALRGLPASDPALETELQSIIASYEAQKAEAPFSYKELFQNDKTQTFRRVCLGFSIQAAQQLSGINLVSSSPTRFSLLL